MQYHRVYKRAHSQSEHHKSYLRSLDRIIEFDCECVCICRNVMHVYGREKVYFYPVFLRWTVISCCWFFVRHVPQFLKLLPSKQHLYQRKKTIARKLRSILVCVCVCVCVQNSYILNVIEIDLVQWMSVPRLQNE